MTGKIDVDAHAVPAFFKEHLRALEGSGVPVVLCLLDATRAINSKLGAPGPEITDDREGARKVARDYNEWTSQLKKDDPSHFGFFPAVAPMYDSEGCLAEIAHALDELDANGFRIFTTYGGKHPGDHSFDPIWSELNKRKAVVFVHPIQPKGYRPVSPLMQAPTLDFPHETVHTGAHMVIIGTKGRYADVKVILYHAGSTLPLLAEWLTQRNSGLSKDKLKKSSPILAEQMRPMRRAFASIWRFQALTMFWT